MKIGILTWYKAMNHGAVLQTYASCKMLESIGYKPVVLDYDWNLDEATQKSIQNMMSKLSINKILWKIKVRSFFKKKTHVFKEFCNDRLPLGKKYDEEDNLDCVYIGSDMVFDISEGYNPYMYGYGVPVDYIFSYAASFGYTTLKKLKNHPNSQIIIDAINNLQTIGYRDNNTRFICDAIAPDVPKIENVDPVLAYGFKNEISEWDTEKWKDVNYLLVYAYESTMNNADEVNAIKEIARKEQLTIVSCGYYHKWCDKCINASPEEFVELIKHAKYVVTDTFHGTVFSLLMHKKLAVIIRKNGFKVRHLLSKCKMEDCIANNSDEIEFILKNEKDYSWFDEWRLIEEKNTFNYLQSNIEKAVKR